MTRPRFDPFRDPRGWVAAPLRGVGQALDPSRWLARVGQPFRPFRRLTDRLDAEQTRRRADQDRAEQRAAELAALDPARRRAAARPVLRCPRNHVLAEVHRVDGWPFALLTESRWPDHLERSADGVYRFAERRGKRVVVPLHDAAGSVRVRCRCTAATVPTEQLARWTEQGRHAVTLGRAPTIAARGPLTAP